MTEWVYEWDYKDPPQFLTTEKLIKRTIEDSEVQGEIESLRNRVELMTKMVAKLISVAPIELQKEIINDISYGWKPLEEL